MPYLLATLLTVAAALVLAVALSLRAIPRGSVCPACTAESLPLRSRLLRLVSAMTGAALSLRWCPRCGWQGLVRVAPASVAPAPIAPASSASPTRDALPVRSIRLSGAPWEVRLRCWHQDGLWLGRLLFVSPNGRVWADKRPGFCGSTISGVIGQAASLTDPALAGRLQQLISD